MRAAPSTIAGNGTFRNAIATKAATARPTATGPLSARRATLSNASSTTASTAAFSPNSSPCTNGTWPKLKAIADSAVITTAPGNTNSRPAISPPGTRCSSQPA